MKAQISRKFVVTTGLFVCLWPVVLAGEENPAPARLNAALQAAVASSPAESALPPAALEELISEALRDNPGVQSALRLVEARRRRVPQARALPDPVVSVGWMGDIKPFGVQRQDPSSYRSLSAMQEIPYPGKLKLRGDIADREAEALWWDYEAVRRAVVAEVKTAYYDYFAAFKAIEITRKNQDLLEKLVKIAETRYQVGKGIQQDVLKAQVELSRLRQRLTVFEQEQRTAQVRLNTLLFRAAEMPLGPPASVEMAKLTYALETLYQLARENDTSLQREQRLIERSQLAVNLARKEYYPDLGVGYMYQNRPLMPEMHGFTFSVNIPIFYKSKQREGVNEATEELVSAERSRENRETMLSFEVKQQYLAAKASEELARLYSQAVVPQSSLALESALAAYEVGSVDFLTLVDNFVTVLDYEIEYYREVANYQVTLARLEPLVGVELTK
jgi:outer membrane protein TolC